MAISKKTARAIESALKKATKLKRLEDETQKDWISRLVAATDNLDDASFDDMGDEACDFAVGVNDCINNGIPFSDFDGSEIKDDVEEEEEEKAGEPSNDSDDEGLDLPETEEEEEEKPPQASRRKKATSKKATSKKATSKKGEAKKPGTFDSLVTGEPLKPTEALREWALLNLDDVMADARGDRSAFIEKAIESEIGQAWVAMLKKHGAKKDPVSTISVSASSVHFNVSRTVAAIERVFDVKIGDLKKRRKKKKGVSKD